MPKLYISICPGSHSVQWTEFIIFPVSDIFILEIIDNKILIAIYALILIVAI